jgi:hypothetical protein
LLWAVAGLIGPLLFLSGLDPGPFAGWPVSVVFPTWLFGWSAMGQSSAVGNSIVAAITLANVAVFVAVGFVSLRFAKLGLGMRLAATVGTHLAACALATFAALEFA